jgi:hypothetical protein
MIQQECLFGALFNGIDKPLKFIPVTDEQRFMFLHEMEFPDINLIKAESIESVFADIGKRRVDFVTSELLNTVRPKEVKLNVSHDIFHLKKPLLKPSPIKRAIPLACYGKG